jgi:hypothetical protein
MEREMKEQRDKATFAFISLTHKHFISPLSQRWVEHLVGHSNSTPINSLKYISLKHYKTELAKFFLSTSSTTPRWFLPSLMSASVFGDIVEVPSKAKVQLDL